VLEIGGPGGPPFVWWRGQLKSKHKVPRLRVPIRKRIHPLLDLDLELQIPFDALNAGFPYVVLTATRRKSPPKRSLDEAPSRIFLP
jgi:hypothetical protein